MRVVIASLALAFAIVMYAPIISHAADMTPEKAQALKDKKANKKSTTEETTTKKSTTDEDNAASSKKLHPNDE